MNYAIFTPPSITPATVIRPAPQGGDMQVENPEQIILPAGASVVYTPPNYSRFSGVAPNRTLLLAISTGTATGAEIFAAFPDIREPKALEIRAEGAKRLRAMAYPYTDEEQKTWVTQQSQALEYVADNTAPCVTIRNMATTRGVALADMVSRILGNATAFEPYIGTVLGQQQRLLDQIYAATDYDSMLNISW